MQQAIFFFLSIKHFIGYWHPAFPLSPRVYICDAAAVIFFLLAPLQAPHSVTANNSSSTSLLVKRSHLSMEGFQGKPIGYNITYQSTDVKSRIYFAKVNHTTNISTLGRLTVYAMYEIFLNYS